MFTRQPSWFNSRRLMAATHDSRTIFTTKGRICGDSRRGLQGYTRGEIQEQLGRFVANSDTGFYIDLAEN